MTDSIDPAERPFSVPWTILSVVLFMVVELTIGAWLGPHILGRYVSPMFHPQVQMALHLIAFYLGGLGVGVVSPGRRLVEPALGGFLTVLLVFLMGFFMPGWYWTFDLTKVLVGGGIGMLCALLGAWQGEKWMGNLVPHSEASQSTVRGKLRDSLWAEEEALSRPPDRDRV